MKTLTHTAAPILETVLISSSYNKTNIKFNKSYMMVRAENT